MPAIQAITAMTCSAPIQTMWSERNVIAVSLPKGTRGEFIGTETTAGAAGDRASAVCCHDQIGERGDEFRMRAYGRDAQIIGHAAHLGKMGVLDIELDKGLGVFGHERDRRHDDALAVLAGA